MNFRKRRYNDPDPIHWSPTELTKCPKALLRKKEGHKKEYSEDTLSIFEKGSEIHLETDILRSGAKAVIETELHATIIHESEEYIVSGYMDFLMFDLKGLYIEDLKSCNKGAFYYFMKEIGSPSEKLQVSIYAFLYFIIHGVRIKKGVITKIDRENPRNRISLEIDLIPINEIQSLIEDHPTINFLLEKTNKKEFLRRTKAYIKKNRWMCKYCDDSDCSIKKQLETGDKKQK